MSRGPLLHDKRTKKSKFIVRVTSVNHSETVNHTGMPKDNIWRSQQVDYGIVIRGLRLDFTNNPNVVATIPSTVGGEVDYPNVGDYVIVEDSSSGYLPYVIGTVNSLSQLADADVPQERQEELNTWDNGVRQFARPLAPSLELPGNRGRVYTYNPIYMTFHEKYTDDKATDSYFGRWYDRFVKFDSSDTYKNKKSLLSYNESWVKEGLESGEKQWQEPLLYMLESWKNPRKLEDSFYLKASRYAYRPDPVFDTQSDYHQAKIDTPIVKSKDGGADLFSASGVDTWDKYPMPLPLQDSYDDNNKLDYTAYDEMVNESLAQIRRAAHNSSNAQLPLEPKEEKQFRMGRNKILMADMNGDGKQIMVTIKTAGDQQFTMMLHDNGASKTSQVRVRGLFGESYLMESTGSSREDAVGRMTFKGLNGQLVEMYDSVPDDNNYIYMMSSDGAEMKDDYSLTKGSYVLIANNMIPGSANRVLNNPNVTSAGRMISMGIYDGDNSSTRNSVYAGDTIYTSDRVGSGTTYVNDRKAVTTGIDKVATHEVTRQYSGSIYAKDTTTVSELNSTVSRQVFKDGKQVQHFYDAEMRRYMIQTIDPIDGVLSYLELMADIATIDAKTQVILGDNSDKALAGVARVGDKVDVGGMIGTIIEGDNKVVS